MNIVSFGSYEKWCRRILVIFASIFVCATLWYGINFPYPTPWWDHWDYWRQYIEAENFFYFIWNTTTEHRLMGTRALMLLDLWLSDGSGYLIRLFSYLFQAGTGVFLVLTLSQDRNVTGNATTVYACLISMILFFLSQWEAFYLTTLVQVYAVNFFGVGALYFLSRYTQSDSGRAAKLWLFWAIVFAISASLNFTTGIIVFPLMLAILFVQRKNWKHFLYVAVCFLLVSWTYYLNRKIGGNQGGQLWITSALASIDATRASEVIELIFYFLKFYLVLIGSAFPLDSLGLPHLLVGKVIGSVGLGAFFGALILIGRGAIKNKYLKNQDILWLVLLLFLSLSLAAILFGRSGGSLTSASGSRYRVFSLIFWAMLFGYYMPFIVRFRYRAIIIAYSALVVAFVFGLSYEQLRYTRYPIWRLPHHLEGALSLKVGSPDYVQLARSYPAAGIRNNVLKTSAWMKREKIHMFSDPKVELIGDNLSDHFSVLLRTCGELEWLKTHTRGVGGLKLGGWAFDPVYPRPGKYILILNGQERIIGLGNVGCPHKVSKGNGLGRRTGWVAYSRHPTLGLEEVRAYLVLNRLPKVEIVCPLEAKWK